MATQPARAWTYTGGYPDTLKLSNIEPPSPDTFQADRDGQAHILVKIAACALNPVDSASFQRHQRTITTTS